MTHNTLIPDLKAFEATIEGLPENSIVNEQLASSSIAKIIGLHYSSPCEDWPFPHVSYGRGVKQATREVFLKAIRDFTSKNEQEAT